MSRLKEDILEHLIKKLKKKKNTVRKDLSILRSNYPNCTLNAVAYIYARQYKFSILRMLDKEDKKTLPELNVIHEKSKIREKSIKQKRLNVLIIKHKTDNYFYNKHFDEINRAYDSKCFTCVNILLRKIIENLIIDILRTKYPPNIKTNKELYWDFARNTYKDFSRVLSSLHQKRIDFSMDKKKIERLHSLCKNFKDDANDKTHSLYYIVERKEEIDDLKVDTIFELIKEISTSIRLNILL